MSLQTIQLELPDTIKLDAARFGLAAHLVYAGSVTLKEALGIAGMERKAFIRAMLDLGGDMAEAIEDALDVEASNEALEEMERTGEKPIPFEDVLKECGLSLDDLADADGDK